MANRIKDILNKLKNNPFVAVLSVIVIGIAVFVTFTLSKAVDTRIQQIENAKTTEQTTVEKIPEKEENKSDNNVKVGVLKKYTDKIQTIKVTKEVNRIAVNVEYTSEEALLEEHYAENAFTVDVIPVFCFYVNNGTQVELPGELRFLNDGKTVAYYLSETDDFANIMSLIENTTVTLENIMSNPFNVYLTHKTKDGVGKTIFGTYGQTVEQFKAAHLSVPADVVDLNDHVKEVKTTVADKFIWVDIYFKDEDAYNKYNSKEKSNFIYFGFEKGGKLYKWNFLVTEYDSLNMLRCKFDELSLTELLKEMEAEKITVKQFFEDYDIGVWCSDYKVETDLFCINESTDARERLKKSTAQNEVTTTQQQN